MRIATYNINGVKARLPRLLEWLEETQPDVACLQEVKSQDEGFPVADFERAGYGAIWHGQKAFNGVAILAKGVKPVEAQRTLPGDPEDEHARYIEADVFGIRVASIYLPNGNPLPGPKFDYKLGWMRRLQLRAAELLAAEIPAVLAGDYNVVPYPHDIWSPGALLDDALRQPESIAAYRTLLGQGWTDALASHYPQGGVWTFWDFQAGAWQRDHGFRIDHLLLSPVIADRLISCGVDKEHRGREKASDHAPTWVEPGALKSHEEARAQGRIVVRSIKAVGGTLYRYSRGIFSHIAFVLPDWSAFLLNVLLGFVGAQSGLYLLFSVTGNAPPWNELVIASLTIAMTFQMVLSAMSVGWSLRYDMNVGKFDPALQHKLVLKYRRQGRYKILELNNQAMAYDPLLWSTLDKGRNPLVLIKTSYRLPQAIHDMRVRLIFKVKEMKLDTFNSKKVRLASCLSPATIEHGEEICLQQTDYYSDRFTNNLFLRHIEIERLSILPIYDWGVGPDGLLSDFEQSPFSNQLGGSTLLFTADRKIAYLGQGEQSDENRNRLAPSGSGSFDWQDIARSAQKAGQTFQELAKHAIFRELVEEIGLKAPEAHCFHRLIGFGRYLYRGGKPEVFSVIATKLNFSSLSVRELEWDLVDRQIRSFQLSDNRNAAALINDTTQFASLLQNMRSSDVSGPLYFNAVLVREAFENGLANEMAEWFAT